MALSTGSRLGPYEILAPIGSGGMGVVYKARDTRLDRIVAIKVSNESFSKRFEREARAVAALNHTHICTLHDIGPDYLVMEYIDGEPVVSQTRPVPMAVPEALRIAIQIASALEAAHAKGILHRDLKPANILLTKSGVKLLDFGLAKIAEPATRSPDDTFTNSITAAGQILGTVQYMSPEQFQGHEADVRSDIFSFGLVLYEMLTGRRAFQAANQASLIAAVLKDDPPPVASLLPSTSPLLDRTVLKCLQKDPDRRWQSAADLRDELAWIATNVEREVSSVSRRSIFPWIATAATGAGAASLALWQWGKRTSGGPTEATRFLLSPPEGVRIARMFTRQSLALSPVGRRLAMIAGGEQRSMVWVHRLDSLSATPLPGTEGATMVFWSPDGAFIGFWEGGKLKKIPADGGTPLNICDLPAAWSATWSLNNRIVVHTAFPPDSVAISVQSGAVNKFKPLMWPKFLPSGKHLLYVNQDPTVKGLRAFAVEMSSGRETGLMRTDTQVTFTPDQPGGSLGYLLFGRNGTLQALRFDANRASTIGQPMPLAKDVPFFGGLGWSEFDTSADGALIFSTGSQDAQLTWLDRSGRDLGPVDASRDFFGFFRLSPDGKKVAADVFNFNQGSTDIWICDLSHATIERVTLEPGSASPVWSPDGTRIAYGRGFNEPLHLKTKPVDDSGGEIGFPAGSFQLPTDWSPDNRWIFYQNTGGEANAEIWVASVAQRKLMPLLQTPFDNSYAALSPNGEYLAFSANDTGRPEVYVQRFQGDDRPKLVGPRQRVSHNGGSGPRWRRDGKELFFLSLDRQVTVVPVQQGAGINFGFPVALFRLPTSYRSLAPSTVGYDVSNDGQRFLVPVRRAVGAPLQVVLNWQAGLRASNG